MAFEFGFQKFGDEEDEDEELDFHFGGGMRDGLILLLDCTKPMFDVDDEDEDESLFQRCIRCCKTTLQNKIISSEKDLIGVVFFGTEKSKNPNDFKHIYIYQELDQPGAPRILQLEEMCEENYKTFTVDYGHSPAFSLSEALWTCQNMFANSPQKVNSKRILLFTCNDNPHAGNQQLQRQAKTKASDLNETGIDLELMHLQLPGETFDVTKFYKDLLYTDDDELTELPDPAEKLEELLSRVRSKDHKKRALRHISLSLGEGLEMGVGVYNLVRPCTKPYPVKLDKRTNEELKSHSKTYLKDTGEVLMPQDLKKCQTYGGKRIFFENEEVNQIKRFDPSGLYLMGFKPRSSLKIYFKVKPASFIYPDEKTIIGSTTLFTALLKKCVDRDVVPICKYIPGKNYPPRFVALLPQEEECDEHKVQLCPPGFHVIFLPFADDFRKVKYEQNTKANSDQIDAAKEILKKLQFTYSAESFENPVLQKHWRNIEALALDRDSPEEMTDYTLPDEDRIKRRAGDAIDQFKDLVFPAGYVAGAKRKAGGGGDPGAKRAKTEQAASGVDLKAEAEAGRLGKLTVPILKEKIKENGISCTGTRKADLIDAICAHFNVGV
ncbi:X-ray repair cross-complementing protein 6-like [Ruditapes philippinarum]|uniref:X-ray repair cross-complementing protein 6-like n=1 Tax=Ruditapes philippinarum TaxID=129788 RepID=UPI00295A9F61|nr:X-ray repair cross-complementing protein 6-like [Ruditapes philippinarum]XP_060576718.1 X-ray repair cross-complementing protein 6-like [Ruditapes philippinarum]